MWRRCSHETSRTAANQPGLVVGKTVAGLGRLLNIPLGSIAPQHILPFMADTHVSAIGKYRIIELVGEGAMGVVYKAQDSVLDRTVAIKVMNDSIARQADLRSDSCTRRRRPDRSSIRMWYAYTTSAKWMATCSSRWNSSTALIWSG